jgi:hypothetical protein
VGRQLVARLLAAGHEGTDNLLSAGPAVGVRAFIAQSYADWPYARAAGSLKVESARPDALP